MGSSNDGSTAAPGALDDLSDDERSDPAQRGFFGRLLSAFSSATDSDTPSAAATTAETASASAGLGALRRMRVDDVAIPKNEIVAVPLSIGKDELVEVFREHGFSRVPVYKVTLDHPQGLVLLKDLALQHGFGATGRFSLKRLLRPILYAPPSMPTGVLLQKMQKERVHMALVIDEYGGVDGLVTIEDLIETVIGEIEDEHDEDEGALWKEEKPGVILAQSTAPLEEIEAALGIRLRSGEEDEEIDTLGGLVFLRTGRVPARGEVVTHESGAEIEIVDADPRRIKRLRVRLPNQAAD
ncbi:MAG: transporter associated domain-containing protein [Tabrizicola sp.]|uniref:transporter associated domain-containing protein n=1 Tax=Tabrizicola sp. TaxID=2005166 RepID=UPI0027360872|nr:transporter associated domain-containing protein [Tabrizicola sp.]MDP3261525.1 transporter associated domain-containing protein [Tabrizicola sp.]MDP3649314.1 transporter associated domain-containing protein [Paracoccaceae bacterium]MDZ4068936.1 transporter associated domain-containing protein [Tabrizicola sp.]